MTTWTPLLVFAPLLFLLIFSSSEHKPRTVITKHKKYKLKRN